ncbi:response regulator [Flavobacterium sp. 245]|uniref:response regulator n=1 Tax=Flavobacterium sp. 245 TaxID=2512115 RepID=UPI00105E420D|nr:response regulator [Flavobacterium sp. 245]TDO94543.1 response regulator receiver domain-containing protein [Flavobacterium sp. 245]
MPLNPTFLLIEDNLIDQLVIKQLFKKVLGIDQVHLANNGKEGLQWLFYNLETCTPLIILLDIQMPIMNGFDFLKTFDQFDEKYKNDIQIYVLSSTLDQDEIDEITKNKYVQKMLSKPFPIEEFKDKFYLNITAS